MLLPRIIARFINEYAFLTKYTTSFYLHNEILHSCTREVSIAGYSQLQFFDG